MNTLAKSKYYLILVIVFILLFALGYFLLTKSYSKLHATRLASAKITKFGNNQLVQDVELPIRLKIPAIQVDTSIDLMGIDADGLMQSPNNAKSVGWYKQGPRPGDIGSAVIDGHYGKWQGGYNSVFDNLHTLQKGDSVYVESSSGSTVTFIVRELRMYNPKANSNDVFISNDGLSHLNLITCDGSWDEESKSYSKRLIVFTDML